MASRPELAFRTEMAFLPEMAFCQKLLFSRKGFLAKNNFVKFDVAFWLEMAFCQIWLKRLTAQSIERFGSPLMDESFQACFIGTYFSFQKVVKSLFSKKKSCQRSLWTTPYLLLTEGQMDLALHQFQNAIWPKIPAGLEWTTFVPYCILDLKIWILNENTFSLTNIQVCIKGQIISKGLFGILDSPKKWTKKFDFNTMIPQVRTVIIR